MTSISILLTMLLCVSAAAGAQTTCTQFSFTAEVRAGESFTRPIGNDLSFGVAPEEANGIHGWHFEIGPTTPTPDEVSGYVFLVTPPYHFRHPTDLTTDYGVPAQYAVPPGGRIRFWFVLSRAHAKAASDALDHDIWPQDEEDEASRGKVREKLPKGRGEFLILDSRVTPGEADKHGNCKLETCGGVTYCNLEICGSMQWMRFRVTLVVPPTFKVASGLRPTSAPCPGLWQ